jgi:hypothetical protein
LARETHHAYAVIRLDAYLAPDVPIRERITVKKVVASQEVAEQEVARLNDLNADKGCEYFWQVTRVEEST